MATEQVTNGLYWPFKWVSEYSERVTKPFETDGVLPFETPKQLLQSPLQIILQSINWFVDAFTDIEGAGRLKMATWDSCNVLSY